MVELTAFEHKILTIMLKKNRWMTATEIAKFGKMSWNTAHKYLNTIYGRRWISKRGNYWRARR